MDKITLVNIWVNSLINLDHQLRKYYDIMNDVDKHHVRQLVIQKLREFNKDQKGQTIVNTLDNPTKI